MVTQVKSVLQNSRSNLLQDAVGVASLVVMLVVGLHLPGLV